MDNLQFGGAGLIALAGRPGFTFLRVRRGVLPEDPPGDLDAIVHLAAVVGYPACHADPGRAQFVNVGGTEEIVAVARGREIPIFYASTADIYAPRQDRAVCESDEIAATSEYAQSKADAERRVLAYEKGVAFRFATGCGVSPRMRLDLVFNDYCFRAVKDRYLCVYEAGFLRNFVHVEDMAEALTLGLAAWPDLAGRAWNVTGPDGMTLTKGALADEIGQRTGARIYQAGEGVGRDVDRRSYRLDGARLRSALGYVPCWGLDETLAQVLAACALIEVKNEYRAG